MSRETVLQDALQLPPRDRAFLVGALAQSIDQEDFATPEIPQQLPNDRRKRALLIFGVLGFVALAVGAYRYAASYSLPLPLPHLGQAKGTILIDGKPAKGVRVQFIPISATAKSTGGREIHVRASSGITNDRGEYELIYINNVYGAALGKHTVEITYEVGGRSLFAPNFGPGNSQLYDVTSVERPFDFSWTLPLTN